MSSILVVTPLVVASWPLMSAAITAAVGTMGFAAAQNQAARDRGRSPIPRLAPRSSWKTARSSPAAPAAASRWSSSATASARSSAATLEAPSSFASRERGQSKAELKRIGETLVGRVTQQYAYHRLVSELKERRMTILEERVGKDQAIHIRVRNG